MFLKDKASINVDLFDSYHASNTANSVPIIGSDGKLPIIIVPTGTSSTQVALGNHGHDSYVQGNTSSRTTDQNGNNNDINKSGFYRSSLTPGSSNIFPGGSHSHILHGQHPSSKHAYQIGFPYSDSNKMYFRAKGDVDTWNAWKQLWHDGNLIFGTGNTNMARGNHNHDTSYLKLTGGIVTGETTFNNYLSLNAWPGYGTGRMQMWYNNTDKELVIQPSLVTNIRVNGNLVYHQGNKPTWSDVGAIQAGNWRTNGNQDLLVHNKRALVGTSNGSLHLSYGGDFANVYVNNNKIYHQGFKPTALDIGVHTPEQSAYLNSLRDFTKGTLIKTEVNYTNGIPWLLELKGNSYGSKLPFDIKVQGYCYNDTVINGGGISNGSSPFTNIFCFSLNDKICFWFPRHSYWQGFSAYFSTVTSAGRNTNKILSILDDVKPTSIIKEVNIAMDHSYTTNRKPTATDVGARPITWTPSKAEVEAVLTGTIGSHGHNVTVLKGNYQSTVPVTSLGTDFKYYYNLAKDTTGLFPNSSNANSILQLGKHGGDYDSQLGFSSNGNIYYRSFNAVKPDTVTKWKQLAFMDNIINNEDSWKVSYKEIVANTNLDNLLEGGHYVSGTDGNSQSFINRPPGTQGFSLEVRVIWNNATPRINQIVYMRNVNEVYMRSKDEASGWSTWKHVSANSWRPVVNNLTSTITDQSLSAAQGKVLKDLVDSKSTSNHNHDGRYFRADAANSTDIRLSSGDGRGLRFWDSDSYKIYMSSTGHATFGGRVAGETISDYNIYSKITGNTRGFVWKTDRGTVAGITYEGDIKAKGHISVGDNKVQMKYNSTSESLDFIFS